MNNDEVTLVAFEIVAHAGDARSKLITALKEAKNKNFSEAEKLINEAEKCLVRAHKAQTDMLFQESQGQNIEISFIMVHAQDHLMTTLLLKDVIDTLMDVYR